MKEGNTKTIARPKKSGPQRRVYLLNPPSPSMPMLQYAGSGGCFVLSYVCVFTRDVGKISLISSGDGGGKTSKILSCDW